MKRVISIGPYTWDEDQGYWYSEERVIEGTLRVIEDQVCVAEEGKLYLEESQYDPCTQSSRNELKVVWWIPFEFENTNSSE